MDEKQKPVCGLCQRHQKLETVDGMAFWIEWDENGRPRLCMDSTTAGGGLNVLCVQFCPICGRRCENIVEMEENHGEARKPPVFDGNVARQAQAPYLRTKKPESERVQENREAAGHVICLCFMVALNDRYGIGEGRLQRVTDAANGVLERFAINQRAVGMERAKKLLNETLAGLYDGDFVLPITKPPKKARDWAMLGEQREAAEIVVKCYALGAHKALGFGRERLEETIKATEAVFREFGEWAKGGDYFGYAMLARRLTEILGEPVEVDESKADEPIFSRTLD